MDRGARGVPTPVPWGKLKEQLGAPASLKEANMPAQLELGAQSPGLHVGAALGKSLSASSKALSTLVPSKQLKAGIGQQNSLVQFQIPP